MTPVLLFLILCVLLAIFHKLTLILESLSNVSDIFAPDDVVSPAPTAYMDDIDKVDSILKSMERSERHLQEYRRLWPNTKH
jgi:hypothetical protein